MNFDHDTYLVSLSGEKWDMFLFIFVESMILNATQKKAIGLEPIEHNLQDVLLKLYIQKVLQLKVLIPGCYVLPSRIFLVFVLKVT